MTLNRRTFLKRAGGAAFAPSLVGLAACNDLPTEATPEVDPSLSFHGSHGGHGRPGSYGALIESVDSPELMIPEGFRCIRISEVTRPSQADSDFIVPQALDGMAAFGLPNGNIRLIRNHEIRDSAAVATPFGSNPYDTKAGGGTTSLEVDIKRSPRGHHEEEIVEVEVKAEYPSLSGTLVNCAGGPTPWGSWLTCEETTEGKPDRNQDHGYVFEIPSDATGPVDPVPLKALGRFVHEAVAIDPRSGIVYLTEDRSYVASSGLGSGFYRFLPERGLDEGTLQVLAVRGEPNYVTATGQLPGRVLPVEWVDIDDPDPSDAVSDTYAVFKQARLPTTSR